MRKFSIVTKGAKYLLGRLVGPAARRLGYVPESVTSHPPDKDSHGTDDLLNNCFKLLQKLNLEPNHIVDIGTNRGGWTREALRVFPDATYSLFEPQYWLKDEMMDLLDNENIRFYPVGIGDQCGTFKFTLTDRDDSSSFRYSDGDAQERGLEQIDVPIHTLDEFISDHALQVPEMIKIDAEGIDLKVLRGAGKCLEIAEVFFVEAAVSNDVFDNTVAEVVRFMNEKGYQLFDITDLNRPFDLKLLWLVELVFVRKTGSVLEQINNKWNSGLLSSG